MSSLRKCMAAQRGAGLPDYGRSGWIDSMRTSLIGHVIGAMRTPGYARNVR
jgi:hypothetical protein